MRFTATALLWGITGAVCMMGTVAIALACAKHNYPPM